MVVCGGHEIQLCPRSARAHAGSVVVCGGHGVRWMARSVHVLAVWWCVVDMGSNGWQCVQCGQCSVVAVVWWTWGVSAQCWQCGGVWDPMSTTHHHTASTCTDHAIHWTPCPPHTTTLLAYALTTPSHGMSTTACVYVHLITPLDPHVHHRSANHPHAVELDKLEMGY